MKRVYNEYICPFKQKSKLISSKIIDNDKNKRKRYQNTGKIENTNTNSTVQITAHSDTNTIIRRLMMILVL